MPRVKGGFSFEVGGQKYTMPWTDPKREPTDTELLAFAQSQQNPLQKLATRSSWDKANEPIITLPSEIGSAIAEKIDPSNTRAEDRGIVRPFIAGSIKGAGDLASAFTSPISLGLMAVTAGGRAAAGHYGRAIKGTEALDKAIIRSKILGKVAPEWAAESASAKQAADKALALTKAARAIEAGAGTGMIAHGGYNAVTGETIDEVTAGLIEAAIGAGGLYGGIKGYAGAKPLNIKPPEFIPERARLTSGVENKALGPGKTVGSNLELEPPPSLREALKVGGIVKPIDEVNPATGFKSGTPADQAARFIVNERGGVGDAAQKYQLDTGPNRPYPGKDIIDPSTAKLIEDPKTGKLTVGWFSPTILPEEYGQVINLPADVAASHAVEGIKAPTALGTGPSKSDAQVMMDALIPNRYKIKTKPTFSESPESVDLPSAREFQSGVAANEINIAPPTTKSPYEGFPFSRTRVFSEEAPKVKLPPTKDAFLPYFQDWVNSRRAASAEAAFMGRDFGVLDKMYPAEGDKTSLVRFAEEYQKNPRANEVFAKLNKALDDLYGVGTQEFNLHFKKNYLPQLFEPKEGKNFWKDLESKIPEGKHISTNPFFTKHSFFKTYTDAIKKGWVPRFKTPSELLTYYAKAVHNADADKRFFRVMTENDWLHPESEIPRGTKGWYNLDSNHVPVHHIGPKGNYAAPEMMAEAINNYLVPLGSTKVGRVLKMGAELSDWAKNIYLSSGIPFTSINVHGGNLARRDFYARGAKSIWDAPSNIFGQTKKWQNVLDDPAERAKILQSIRNGAIIGVENRDFARNTEPTWLAEKFGKSKLGRVALKANEMQQKAFEDPLFQGAAVYRKYNFLKEQEANLISKGIDPQRANKVASKQANDIYGGINTEAAKGFAFEPPGRSKGLQTIYKNIFLAPDWFESNLNLGKGIYQSLRHPSVENKIYRDILTRQMMTRVPQIAGKGILAATGANAAFDPFGKADSTTIGLGTTASGRERKFPIYGTAAEFPLNIPEAVIGGMAGGNLGVLGEKTRSRLGAIPRSIGNFIFNKGGMNSPLYRTDNYGNPLPAWRQAANIGQNFMQPFIPPYANAAINSPLGLNNLGWEEAFATGFEMPTQYRWKPREQAHNWNIRF